MDTGYPQALDYLFHHLPMFSHQGKAAYKGDLNNIILLCQRLGNPQEGLRTVHVAGTNGKGSVSHMLAAIFQQAGYRTGLYTSPHLRDFRERIRVDGQMIDPDWVADFVKRIRPLIPDFQPSFFEMTVAMAFDYFVGKKVDIAIIETGLGGRLDSTNIIHPDISVITNISFDHQNILGDTLELIAAEKAGIIKPGVPAVIGQFQEEVAEVFRKKAGEAGMPLGFADREYKSLSVRPEGSHLDIRVQKQGDSLMETFSLDLNGRYQVANLLTVLSATDRLRELGWNLSPEAVRSALGQVRTLTGLRGRWDQVGESPRVILDVGHNEAGITEIRHQLAALDYDQLRIVLGVVRDKDTSRMLKALPPEAEYYFCQAAIPRALEDHALAEMAGAMGLRGKAFGTSASALSAARAQAGKNDLILVCGSCFVVGELL